MKVFLTSKLAGHRRGRFLAAQLQAQEVGEGLPEAGVLLLTGTDLQTSENAQRDALVAWCARPGRAAAAAGCGRPRGLTDALRRGCAGRTRLR